MNQEPTDPLPPAGVCMPQQLINIIFFSPLQHRLGSDKNMFATCPSMHASGFEMGTSNCVRLGWAGLGQVSLINASQVS